MVQCAYVICSVTGQLHSKYIYDKHLVSFFCLACPLLFHCQWKIILIVAEKALRFQFRSAFGPDHFHYFRIEISNTKTMSVKSNNYDYYEYYWIEWQCKSKNMCCRIHIWAHNNNTTSGWCRHISGNRWQSKCDGFTMNYERVVLHLVCVYLCLSVCFYVFGVFMMFKYHIVQMLQQCSLSIQNFE